MVWGFVSPSLYPSLLPFQGEVPFFLRNVVGPWIFVQNSPCLPCRGPRTSAPLRWKGRASLCLPSKQELGGCREWACLSGGASAGGRPENWEQEMEQEETLFFSSSQMCLFKSQLPGPPCFLHPAQPVGREGLNLTAARLSVACFMWEEIREKKIMKTMCSNSLTVG